MTVKELIALLNELPPDAPVVVPDRENYHEAEKVTLVRPEDGNLIGGWPYKALWNAAARRWYYQDVHPPYVEMD